MEKPHYPPGFVDGFNAAIDMAVSLAGEEADAHDDEYFTWNALCRLAEKIEELKK
jgi:hypothetical protein